MEQESPRQQTSAAAPPPAKASGRTAPVRSRWRWRRGVVAGVLVLGLAGFAAWFWLLAPRPPRADLSGADPAVAAAVRAAERRLRWWPRSAGRWGRLGAVYYVHDFYDEADRCLSEAERLDPDNPRWPYLRGRSMHDQDPDRALPMLRRAAELSGDDDPPATRMQWAEVLLERGRLDEAEGYFRAVLAHDPSDARALLGMGRLSLSRGNPQEAIDWLGRSVRSRGDVKAAHTLLATAYRRLGRADEAEAELGRAAELPENVLWHDQFLGEALGLRVGREADLERAATLRRQGKAAEAVALLKRVVRDYPDSDQAWLKLALAYMDARRPKDAERAVREALRVAPGRAEAWTELGRALFGQGRYAEAEEGFREALRLNPNLADAWFNLGQCLAKAGDPEGAIRAFARTAELMPDLAIAHADLAGALLNAGRPAEAIEPLNRALQLKPGDPRATHLLNRARRAARQQDLPAPGPRRPAPGGGTDF